MNKIKKVDYDSVLNQRKNIQDGLRNIEPGNDWYAKYEIWRNNENNAFDALLKITNSFDLTCAGDSLSFDVSNQDDMIDLDVICMSVFYQRN